ncbi:hypothetical protein BJ742DRAFT_734372 [Cladochytrium replicatum]|nr:hypothetical protein BJ742DRAFT_734372 [Cladochytrium replicatum]
MIESVDGGEKWRDNADKPQTAATIRKQNKERNHTSTLSCCSVGITRSGVEPHRIPVVRNDVGVGTLDSPHSAVVTIALLRTFGCAIVGDGGRPPEFRDRDNRGGRFACVANPASLGDDALEVGGLFGKLNLTPPQFHLHHGFDIVKKPFELTVPFADAPEPHSPIVQLARGICCCLLPEFPIFDLASLKAGSGSSGGVLSIRVIRKMYHWNNQLCRGAGYWYQFNCQMTNANELHHRVTPRTRIRPHHLDWSEEIMSWVLARPICWLVLVLKSGSADSPDFRHQLDPLLVETMKVPDDPLAGDERHTEPVRALMLPMIVLRLPSFADVQIGGWFVLRCYEGTAEMCDSRAGDVIFVVAIPCGFANVGVGTDEEASVFAATPLFLVLKINGIIWLLECLKRATGTKESSHKMIGRQQRYEVLERPEPKGRCTQFRQHNLRQQKVVQILTTQS